MVCQYKYNNKWYSADEMLEYINSNRNEFNFKTPSKYYSNISLKEYQNNPDYEYQEFTVNTPFDTIAIGHFADSDKVGASTIGHIRAYKSLKDNSLHVIELQSDLFQKNRDKQILNIDIPLEAKRNVEKNQFLQLLNKDGKWVRFFTQAVIQKAANEGYSKVLFPTGITAAKVEGHDTIEEAIQKINNRIEGLKINYEKGLITKEIYEQNTKKNQEEKAHYENAGKEQLKPIEAFYDNRVTNILKKDFDAKPVKDEFGYGFNEVKISKEIKSKVQEILLQEVTNPQIESYKQGDFNEKYFNESRSRKVSEVLKEISEKGVSSDIKVLAQDLLKILGDVASFEINLLPDNSFTVSKFTNEKPFGNYNPSNDLISLNETYKDSRKMEGVVLHEIVHALTVKFIKNNPDKIGELEKIYEEAKRLITDDLPETKYRLSSIYEFIAGAFNDSKFRSKLANLKGVNENTPNILTQLIDWIKSILNIQHATLLDNLFFEVEKIAEIQDPEKNELFPENYDELEVLNEETFQKAQDESHSLYGNLSLEDLSTPEEGVQLTDAESDLIEKQIRRYIQLTAQLRQEKRSEISENLKIQRRIKTIEIGIKRLIENKGYSTILSNHRRQIENGIKLLDDADGKDLEFIQVLLEDSRELSFAMSQVNAELTSEQKSKLSNLNNLIGDLQVKYNKVSTEHANKYANEVGINYLDVSNPQKDISDFMKYGLDVTKARDLPELMVSGRWLNYIKNKTNELINNLKEEIKRIKSKYPDWVNSLKRFVDSKGRLITRYNNSYYEEEFKVLEEKRRVLKNPDSTKREIADAFKMVRDWYIKNSEFTESEVGNQYYQQLERDFIEDITDENGQYDFNELEDFRKENSPQYYLDYLEKVKVNPNYYEPGVTKRVGYHFLLVTPNESYKNPKYDEIENDEIYQFVVNTIKSAQDLIPRRLSYDVGNFDKVLNKFVLDLNSDNPFTAKAFLEGLKNTFTDWFTLAQDKTDLSFKATDSKGNDIERILRPDIEKFTNSNPKDFFDVLTDFTSMAVTYDLQSQVLPILQLMSNKLEERPAIKVKNGKVQYKPEIKDGRIQRDSAGRIVYSDEPEVIQGGLSKAKEILLFTIQAQMFGEVRADRDSTIVKITDKVINFTRALGIGGKVFSGATNYIIGTMNNYIWSAKNLDFSDKEYWKAKRLVLGNILRGLSINKSLTPEARKLALIVDKFNVFGDNLSKFEAGLQGSKLIGSEYNEKLTNLIYFLMTSGEYMIHSEGLLAKLLFTKVTKSDGTEGNLWNYFKENEDGTLGFNSEEYGKQASWEEVTPNSDLNNWLFQFNQYRLGSQGNYSDPLLINKSVLGRSISIFRRWLPESFHQRFGKEASDKSFKGRYWTYGDIYKIFREDQAEGKLGTSLALFKTFAKVAGETSFFNAIKRKIEGKTLEQEYKEFGLSELDINNMRVNIRELRLAAWVYLLILALGAMRGDGDDKDLNFSTNLAQRVFSDLTFFQSPVSAAAIIRDPIPLFNTIRRFNDVRYHAWNYVFHHSTDEYQRGYWEGQSKLKVSTFKAIPVLAAYPNLISVIENRFNNRTYPK